MPDYPQIEIILCVGTWETVVEVCPDTAFEGGISIPRGVGDEIVAEAGRRALMLADGTVTNTRSWSGEVEIENRRVRAEVVSLGTRFLLGREVLDQFEVCFEYGRQVRIKP